jgi:hypothetical protein
VNDHWDPLRAALKREYNCIVDRLRREVVLLIWFEPKHVPWHIKAGDLTATVAKYLATAYQSADHLVQIFGRLASPKISILLA